MKRFILTLGAIASLLPAGAILAQSDTRTDVQGTTTDHMTVTGTIVSIDPSTVVVRADDGRSMTFTRDKDSDVDNELVIGQAVKVEYSGMTGGLYHLDELSKASDQDRSNYSSNPPASTGSVQGNQGTSVSGTYDNSATGTTATGTYSDQTGSRTMPSTASPIPLVGLAGLLALGAGVGLRAYLRN